MGARIISANNEPNDKLIEPQQKRSRATLDRIFQATEKLLEKKRFSEITIAEIAESARCGVGTVYGRFENKDALLFSMEIDSARRFLQGIENLSNRETGLKFHFKIEQNYWSNLSSKDIVFTHISFENWWEAFISE